MKRLKSETFERISLFMKEQARPLDQALFSYDFNNGSSQELLEALRRYQNDDGGFGHGIEPDFQLPHSSPLATSVAFQYLQPLFHNPDAQAMIKKGITYFEKSFNKGAQRWYTVSSKVNDFPHAPWWHFQKETKQTVIDSAYGNPTAEITGYLFQFKDYVSALSPENLYEQLFNHLQSLESYPSPHEIYCYMRLYHQLPEPLRAQLFPYLEGATAELVVTDPSEWDNYVPKPLDFITVSNRPLFGLKEEWIETHLDTWVAQLEEHGYIEPNWEWGAYPESWQKAKQEWRGILTLTALQKLKWFNRL